MSALYPSSITALANPTSGNYLSSPDHATQHANANDEIEAVQSFIGVQSSTYGITYDLRSPESNGGGHVQTADKGGTGQTSYTKGDILVAQSTSVLSKLAVSSVSGLVLTTDGSQSPGMAWKSPRNATLNTSSVIVAGGLSSVTTVIFSSSVVGSVIGNKGGIRFTGFLQNFESETNADCIFIVKYGDNQAATLAFPDGISSITGANSTGGTITGVILADNSYTAQKGYLRADFIRRGVIQASNYMYGGITSIVTSVNSAANQNLVITANYVASGSTKNSILGTNFIVEQIV